MRRKISLYIGDILADISDQTFILFNYTLADLTNPTVMVNAFTQQITLPGTDKNNRIFGGIYRPDRKTIATSSIHTGNAFDPVSRTPFQIYNEAGEILEEGYLKLDKVSRNANGVTSYTVTLYGGLGSFLYGLTYDENGDKLSLADLDFFGTDAPDSELDFIIQASSVQEAWSELERPEGVRAWEVFNFAPCYNGVPSNFAADKALVTPGSTADLPLSVTDDNGTTYYPDNTGYVVANFPEGHTEWDCKDLRSYLQRPVVCVKEILRAIALPRNNGGYTMDLSAIDTSAEFAWQKLWMTLPLLPDLGTYKQISGNATLIPDATPVQSSFTIGKYTVQYIDTPPSGTTVNARLNVAPEVQCVEDAGTYYTSVSKVVNGVRYYHCSFAFVQAVAYDSNNHAVGSSAVSIFGSIPRSYGNDIEAIANACLYNIPYGGTEQYENGRIITATDFELVSSGYYRGPNLALDISCQNVAKYEIYIDAYHFNRRENVQTPSMYIEDNMTNNNNCLIPLWENYDVMRQPSRARIADISPGSYATYISSTRVRSGVRFTKRMLLSGTCSPGEFLVSFCRMFGLYLSVNETEKTVTLMRRNDFFENTVEDLTTRIDRGSGINIEPVAIDAKWYEFSQESTGGAFADQYKAIEGREYGIQRVNTGWAFDAETVDLLEGSAFKSCATVLDSSKYWYNILDGATYYPAVFQDTGATATYYDNGTTHAVDLGGIPYSATATPINANNPGYDMANCPRMEFHDADGKPIDGAGVLCLYLGAKTMPYFRVTDDESVMDILLGNPCWLIDPGDAAGESIALFSRYDIDANGDMQLSLDFGVPNQLDIPAVNYDTTTTIYAKNWKAYIGDLLHRDTKVMTCKVDLRGYQVGRDLLRRFWWYDNALWVLNKITNHSLTTWDLTECEFIQVQDTDDYINGQV